MCAIFHALVVLTALTGDLQAHLTRWQADAVSACEHATEALEAWRAWPHLLVLSVMEAAATAAESGVRSVGHTVLGMYVNESYVLVHMVCASYKTLLLCTVQLVVQSVLSVLDAAAQAIAVAVHDAAHALHDVLNAAGEAGVGIADIAVDSVNAVLGLTGHTLAPPTWHEPGALQYVKPLTQGA